MRETCSPLCDEKTALTSAGGADEILRVGDGNDTMIDGARTAVSRSSTGT